MHLASGMCEGERDGMRTLKQEGISFRIRGDYFLTVYSRGIVESFIPSAHLPSGSDPKLLLFKPQILFTTSRHADVFHSIREIRSQLCWWVRDESPMLLRTQPRGVVSVKNCPIT